MSAGASMWYPDHVCGGLQGYELEQVCDALQAALNFHHLQCPGAERHRCQFCHQLASALALAGGAR